MATDLNEVVLMGNVGQDPEFHTFKSGDRVAKFSVATNVNYKDKQGEWQSIPTWHNVVCYDQIMNDRIEREVHKGVRVYIKGAIKNSVWETDTGEKRYKSEVEIPKYKGMLISLEKKEAKADTSFNYGSNAKPVDDLDDSDIAW